MQLIGQILNRCSFAWIFVAFLGMSCVLRLESDSWGQIPPAPRPDEMGTDRIARFGGSVIGNFSTSTVLNHTSITPTSPTLTIGKNALSVQSALQPIADQVSGSVVQIVSQFDRVSLGTVVTADGLVIAKYSELTKAFDVVLPDGTKLTGRLIGIHPRNDLALIQIAASDLTAIKFRQFDSAQAGSFVVSVGNENRTVGFGLVTSAPQTLALKQPECKDCVDLGATVSAFPVFRLSQVPQDENNPTSVQSGLEVFRVYPRTVSESTGLLVGDLIQSINGHRLESRTRLNEIASDLKIGQTLEFEVIRDGKRISLSHKIRNIAPRTVHDRWGGGPFSERRFGFGDVIIHDSNLLPENCGGPLVNLEGQVIGINIARSMRVATFAIPLDDVYRFVKYVRPNAKLNLITASQVP